MSPAALAAAVVAVGGAIVAASSFAYAYVNGRRGERLRLVAVRSRLGDPKSALVLLEAAMAADVEAMRAHAARDGVQIVITSGFRSYAEQARLRALYEEIQANKPAMERAAAEVRKGAPLEGAAGRAGVTAAALRRFVAVGAAPVARPGFSNHHRKAVDLAVRSSADSPEYRWLDRHAKAYGLANVGRSFTPAELWHWEHVGTRSRGGSQA